MQQRGIRRVAVIGTGTIGASWTANFLARGLEVRASDPAPEAEARLRRFVDAAGRRWRGWRSCRRAPPHDALTFCADPESAVAGVDFVQENAPEREEIKQALLARIDAVLPPEIVIASSSSGLLISRLQAACRHPERCVVGHPFNPPHLIPLVEVVGGERTAPATIEQAMAFYAAHRQAPDPHPPRGAGARRQPAAGGAVARGGAPGRERRGQRRRCRYRDQRGAGTALGADGAAFDLPPRRRRPAAWRISSTSSGRRWRAGGTISASPSLTPEVREALIAGVAAEAAGRDIPTLAAARDQIPDRPAGAEEEQRRLTLSRERREARAEGGGFSAAEPSAGCAPRHPPGARS